MAYQAHGHDGVEPGVAGRDGGGLAPGRRTLTMGMPVRSGAAEGVQRRAAASAASAASAPTEDQFAAAMRPDLPAVASADADPHAAAALGTSGAGGALPFLDTIQPLFGRHDVGGIVAHTDGAARAGAAQMGAEAFATGDHVAFAGAPSLHTAAHEAAHVVQQRGGVSLKGGVGAAGDRYEQHADAVADRVVRGESAAALLDELGGPAAAPPATGAVQHKLVAGPHYVPINSSAAAQEQIDLRTKSAKYLESIGLSHELLAPQDLMADPRVRVLAEDKLYFAFDTWDALRGALGQHWGQGGDVIPEPMLAFRMGAPPTPFTAQPPPTQLGEPAPSNRHFPTSELPKEKEVWENCGKTAQGLIGRMNDVGGEVKLLGTFNLSGMKDAPRLESLLLSPVDQRTFIDVDITAVHNFVIEKRTDGEFYLQQGYSKSYYALWWAGLEEAMLHLKDPDPRLLEAREIFGKGQRVPDLTPLAQRLGALLRGDVWGQPESVPNWEALPFQPTDSVPEGLQRGDRVQREQEIAIVVTVYRVTNEAAVREALRSEHDSLTQGVLTDSHRRLGQGGHL